MRKLIAILLVASVAFLFTPFLSFADMNQQDVKMANFAVGTTAAGSGANSAIFRVPQAAKIDSIYVTDLSGCAASSTNYLECKLFLNNVAYGTLTTSGTALLAVTPRQLVPTGVKLAAGDVLQIQLSKVAGGIATTNLGVTMAYHNANQ